LIDGEAARNGSYFICDPNGCMADFEVNADFVGRLVDILDQLPGERSWRTLWDAAGPELVFTRQAWAAFVEGVKAGPAAR